MSRDADRPGRGDAGTRRRGEEESPRPRVSPSPRPLLPASPPLRVSASSSAGHWLWLAALVLLVLLHFWFPRLGRGVAHDSYSTQAEGKKAFFLLADARTWSAVRNTDLLTRFLPQVGPDATLVLLGPARNPTPLEWDVLLDWVAGGGRLLIAARAEDPELEIPQLQIEVGPLEDADEVETAAVWTPLLRSQDLAWRTSGEIVAPRARPLAGITEPVRAQQAVVQPHGAGRVVVLASDFVFSNQSLAYGENSVLAYRLLAEAGTSGLVVFDESLNITGTPKVVGLLLDPLLRPLTVQLLIVLLLFAWWRSRRFGPLLPKSTPERHNIVDHTDAVGLLTFRSGNGAGSLHSYLRQLLLELRLTAATPQQERRRLEPLARRLGRDVDALRRLLRRCEQASRADRLPRRTAGQFIRRLAILRRAAHAPTNRPSQHESRGGDSVSAVE